MSNQLQSQQQLVLNANPHSITLHNDAMNLLARPIANPCNLTPQVSPNVSILNFNLNGQESNTFAAEMQTQNMSQTAQIVLLPTQNLNLANVPKQEQLQMILPNDVGYQLIPSVGVIVPTTILFTDKNQCILIPQNSPSQTICPTVQPLSTANEVAHINEIDQSSSYTKQWLEPSRLSPQFQMVSTTGSIEYEDGSPTSQHQLVPDADCDFIALANTGTQTVIGGIADSQVPQQSQLLSNNCQIVGIIPTDQLSMLQNEASNQGQMLITACIASDSGAAQEVSPATQENVVPSSTDNYDINTFLASTIASGTIEKSDQNTAKGWLRDSFIVNRALRALSDNESKSPTSSSQVLL